MKQKIKTFLSLLVVLMICTLEVPTIYANETQAQPAMWFMDVVKLTQEPGGGYSHKGTLNFDVIGVNNSDIFAPFDCKIMAIYKTKAEGNTVVIESLAPVLYADGTVDYMTMTFAHDDYVGDLWVGKVIAQGEIFYQTGNYGYVTGRHAHVCCVRGKFKRDIWKRQPPNDNCCSPNAISPETALFLPEGIPVYDTKGLAFQTYTPHTCSSFKPLGMCTECGKEFVLQNRTAMNSQFTATKVDGAIHTAPYGEAEVNGRLQQDIMYTVTESVVNAFGNLWYQLEGTDSNGNEQWVVYDYLKEILSLDHSVNMELPDTEEQPTIVVEATEIDGITIDNATVRGTVSWTGKNKPLEVGVLLGDSPSSLQWVGKDIINFTQEKFNVWYNLGTECNIVLDPGHTYYFQLYAIVDYNKEPIYSNIKSFTTTPTVKVWDTGITNKSSTNATLNGKVTYFGNKIEEVGLMFGTDPVNLKCVARDTIKFAKKTTGTKSFNIWYDLTNEAGITLSSGRYFYCFYVVQENEKDSQKPYYTYSDIAYFNN